MLFAPVLETALLSTKGTRTESSSKYDQQETKYRPNTSSGGHTPEAGHGTGRAHFNDESSYSGVATMSGMVLSDL